MYLPGRAGILSVAVGERRGVNVRRPTARRHVSTPESSANTVQLQRRRERLRAGDASARDELLRAVGARVEQLAHRMLRRFPNVQRWAQTNDGL
jgi:hypothetical protein